MALQNASIPIGATYTPAGGTATTFSPDGVEVKGGLHQSDPTATDMRVQRSLTSKNRPARLDPKTGEWTKAKRGHAIVFPKILASGKMTFPLIRIEVEVHPEQTQAEIDAMFSAGTAACCDADFLSFNRTGNLS